MRALDVFLRTICAAALAFPLAAGSPAAADGPSSLSAPTSGLKDVGREETSGFTELEEEETTTLDELDRQDPGTIDEFSYDEETQLGAQENAGTSSVDQVQSGADAWQPPACEGDELPADVKLPEGGDPAKWEEVLAAADTRLSKAQEGVRKAEQGYVSVKTDPKDRGRLPSAAEALRGARSELAAAHCALPALIEAARRAGVPPGTLRPFADKLEPPTP